MAQLDPKSRSSERGFRNNQNRSLNACQSQATKSLEWLLDEDDHGLPSFNYSQTTIQRDKARNKENSASTNQLMSNFQAAENSEWHEHTSFLLPMPNWIASLMHALTVSLWVAVPAFFCLAFGIWVETLWPQLPQSKVIFTAIGICWGTFNAWYWLHLSKTTDP